MMPSLDAPAVLARAKGETMARPKIRICVDRIIAADRKIAAARAAVEENERNAPDVRALRALLPPGATIHPQKIAILTGKRWTKGRTLNVAFLDGSATQREKTRKHAIAWCDYANVKLVFDGGRDAEIRVSFEADPGSWSAVGTDCLSRPDFPLEQPTMNFGWLRDGTDETEWRRVVLHEFGHALGAIHEHQNPKGSAIQWKREAVYAYFSGPPNNWSRAEIDANVIEKYSLTQLNASTFDPKSIMLYAFPAELVVGGKGTAENTRLSAKDKKFIREWYPGARPRKAARPAARLRRAVG